MPNKKRTRLATPALLLWLSVVFIFLPQAALADRVIADYDNTCCALPPYAPCCTDGAGDGSECIDESCGPTASSQTGICRRTSPDQPVICVQTAEAGERGATGEEGLPDLPVTPALSIDIPTVSLTSATRATGRFVDIPWLADYITGIFRFALPAAAVMAIVVMMVGGLQWLTSGGNSTTVGKARKRIVDAAIGLALIIGGYAILSTINPNLVLLPSLRVESVERENFEYVGADEPSGEPRGGNLLWQGAGASTGTADREGLRSVCQRGTPATAEQFKTIISTWVDLGRQGAAVYVRGGRTRSNECVNHGSASWIRNHLESHSVDFPADASLEDLRSIYQTEMVDKVFAAGRMCGDCVSWTGQLFACAGYNVAMWMISRSETDEHLLAQGTTCAEAASRVPGGLRMGDFFYSDNVGHMFTYTGGAGLPYEIVEMGGLRGSRTTIPGIEGSMAAVNAHTSKDAYFAWVDRNRGERNETLGTSRRQACRVYRILP